jgi:hypothetical protein
MAVCGFRFSVLRHLQTLTRLQVQQKLPERRQVTCLSYQPSPNRMHVQQPSLPESSPRAPYAMGVAALLTDIKGPSGLTSKHEHCFRARTNKILNNDVCFVLEVSIFLAL